MISSSRNLGCSSGTNEAQLAGRRLELSAVNVHKAFGENRVLRGIDLEIREGEMVAIVGGSGSGKTVLLRHFLGDYRPDQGAICVADHETDDNRLVDLATLDDSGLDHLRRHWAVVFQGNALFAGTVYDNIALALREVKGLPEVEIMSRARKVIEAVGLDVEQVLNLDRRQLSGGMAKRVGIARALALEPMLLFYDEPTSGLDPSMAHQIHDLIASAHEHAVSGSPRTSVMITHDKDLLHRLRPRIVMLDGGRVSFDGTFEAFERCDSPVVRPYFELMPGLHQRAHG